MIPQGNFTSDSDGDCKGKEIYNKILQKHEEHQKILEFWCKKLSYDLGCLPPVFEEVFVVIGKKFFNTFFNRVEKQKVQVPVKVYLTKENNIVIPYRHHHDYYDDGITILPLNILDVPYDEEDARFDLENKRVKLNYTDLLEYVVTKIFENRQEFKHLYV